MNILKNTNQKYLVQNNIQLKDILQYDKVFCDIVNNKLVQYYNVSCSFDIETSSWYDSDNKKTACMYIWMFAIADKYIITGRTWKEFIQLIDMLNKYLSLSSNRRLVIYVHNLAYEFQFIRKYFKWDEVFALDIRKPIRAVSGGLEFRCSYLLSGYSLSKLADNLVSHNIKKMVGDLDYTLIRNSKTPLTEEELGYCYNDVLIVNAYIDEQKQQYGNITKIPMTNTGRVREYCRQHCLPTKDRKMYSLYRNLMEQLTLDDDEYAQLKRAFMGGFTHANAEYYGLVSHNVSSYDFTSSYPTQMIAKKYPMSKSKKVVITSKEQFNMLMNTYCCLFDIVYYNIRRKDNVPDDIISLSKCISIDNEVVNNGRVNSADRLLTTITDVDFRNIEKFYDYDKYDIMNFRYYKKSYLPKPFVECILKFYQDKTMLKGVEDKEVEYQNSKGMLNSCYGMIVTNPCRDDSDYTDTWLRAGIDLDSNEKVKDVDNISTKLSNYNKNKKRFLFYPWGIWVTAYSREALFSGILECNDDYLYSDTDSVKITNREKHLEYFENYNNNIIEELKLALKHHKLSEDLITPKDIKGKEHPLGVWDYEGTYDRFKTLGAKRYLVEKHGEYELTVSGLNKKMAVPYMLKKNKDIFELFAEGLYIDKDNTGKNTHTYIDEHKSGIVVDYLGNSASYDEMSSVHMEGAEYTMSISQDYTNFINRIIGGFINGNTY